LKPSLQQAGSSSASSTALAEFERNLIRERTVAGLKAAHARGRNGGSQSKLSPKEIKTIRALLKSAEIPVSEIAARFHIARSTLYRAILLLLDLETLPGVFQWPSVRKFFPFLSCPRMDNENGTYIQASRGKDQSCLLQNLTTMLN